MNRRFLEVSALHILWLEFLYPFDEISLFYTTVTRLVPIVQNFPKIADLQLLQIDRVEVDLFVVAQVAYLSVHLLELFANLVSGHGPAQRLGQLTQNAGGGFLEPAEIVAESVLFILGPLAELLEHFLDLLGVGLDVGF